MSSNRTLIVAGLAATLAIVAIASCVYTKKKECKKSIKTAGPLWKNVSVESIKKDVQLIETKTAELKNNLLQARKSATAADELRAGTRAATVNHGKPLQNNADDDHAVLYSLVRTPFTKQFTMNATAKQMDKVHPDEKVRNASSEARMQITKVKKDFFADEKLYQTVQPVLERLAKSEGDKGKLARGLLKKFAHTGVFQIEDLGKRKKIQDLNQEISRLEASWSRNLQEETGRQILHFTDRELVGIPAGTLQTMKKSEDGKHEVTLSYPHIIPVMKFCMVRETREKVSRAFKGRGGKANEETVLKIIALRNQVAKLLGVESYADVVQSQNRMARSAGRVRKFLEDLEKSTLSKAKEEMAKVTKFATDECELPDYKPWDVEYVLNLYKKKCLDLDNKVIGEYFPDKHVVQEVLQIYQQLLGLKFSSVDTDDVWHKDVQVFAVTDQKSEQFLGRFYLDLYPRPGKYGHACVVNLINTPYGESKVSEHECCAMLCNLSESMSHGDVVTFFHEFGHVMHCLCATIGGKTPYTKVPRDFVEAPSQMLENWCWQSSLIKRLSRHVATQEPMPDEMILKLQDSRHWMGLIPFRRQLFLNAFDQLIHAETVPSSLEELAEHELKLNREIALIEPDEKMKISSLARNFGHTISQYSASYYSYLWSEVFSADMFDSQFSTPEALLDPKIGAKYRNAILFPGGTQDPDDLLKTFLGREPQNAAFLRSYGIE